MPGEPFGIELNWPSVDIVAGGGTSNDDEPDLFCVGAEMIVYNNEQCPVGRNIPCKEMERDVRRSQLR